MNKAELTEFIKSLDLQCEVREGRQFAEVTVPPASTS